MKEISLTHGGHQWDKKNLVTLNDRKGQYDLLRCKFCGIEGKRYSLSTIQVYDRYVKKIDCCPKAPRGKQIQVVRTTAFGPTFANLVPGSVHDVVEAPAGQDSERGVWVMGCGEPVLLLFGEFVYL